MKKIFVLVLSICMTFMLAACSGQSTKENSVAGSSAATVEPQQADEAENNEDLAENSDTDTSAPEEEPSEAETADTGENGAPSGEMGSKVLVAYFSCTGNTEAIANHIVNILGADVYEIVPEEPYTDDDLNYNDSSSRSTEEQNDDSCRPAISDSVENMDDYDIVFIGYPIWWGQAPKIIYTFVESYDFLGKTIVPFCTSSSSGVGSSATNLHSSASGANWIDGTRFSSNASQSDIEEWVNGLDLEMSAQ